MSIRCEDINSHRVDFSDIATGARLEPIHPGKILREKFLEPLGISVYRLAQDIKVPRTRLNDIVRGHRAISTDTALRLACYFDTTLEFWLNLQTRYELDLVNRTLREKIEYGLERRAP